MKLDKRDVPDILEKITTLAYKNRYSKIFSKIPQYAAPLFFADGYFLEAIIPGFYNNKDDAFFVSKILNSDRLLNIENEQLKDLSQLLHAVPYNVAENTTNVSEFKVRLLDRNDIEQLTGIYKEVFATYPFPIHDPDFILKNMDEDVQYYGAEKNGILAAVASSEMDIKGQNSEMTDFATRKDFLGNNLSVLLLRTMEKKMKNQGIKTLHTIARLHSIPMNKTFLKLQYNYAGTLIKNTNIAGRIESMNVYYKHI